MKKKEIKMDISGTGQKDMSFFLVAKGKDEWRSFVSTNELFGCIKYEEIAHWYNITFSKKGWGELHVLRQLQGDFSVALNTTYNASKLTLILNAVPIRHSLVRNVRTACRGKWKLEFWIWNKSGLQQREWNKCTVKRTLLYALDWY